MATLKIRKHNGDVKVARKPNNHHDEGSMLWRVIIRVLLLALVTGSTNLS